MVQYKLEAYELSTAKNIEKYRQTLEALECGSPYYLFELINAVIDNKNDKLNCFVFKEGTSDLVIMPFILRKINIENAPDEVFDVSSPWGYNGPYIKNGIDKELLFEFWKAVDAWYLENKIVSEFVRFGFDMNQSNFSGTVVHTLFNVKGDVTNWETFWGNLKPNTRNQFRKAGKIGLKFEMHFNQIEVQKIEDFYKVYIGTMDRRSAVDSFYHDLEYFINICDNNSGKCAIGLTYLDDMPISTEFFLISDDTIFSFLGGTDSNHFKARPNEFLKINAIEWGKENGLKYYMIGGGLSNSKEDNLYLYKKKYFPNDPDIDFYTGRKIVNQELYKELCGLTMQRESIVAENDISLGFFPKYRQKT